ncbi:MAG: PadR family transcriptional regulator [Methanobrevibacter sp.]|uniref:PadR family transcriptional regulator n=1 Tax=Methanobrevibacter sp. TaxID=66852 RepID=UPI002E789FA0|nr:PadR family transcriptional regulator [Methanobrevibacter sp.]MEE0901150.1 PadR family transcriptional regulator [Methanobrevibacter sp.]MEE0934795.1 PadR family transcriptional regulator [Methanobrevibacter sp.]
MTDEKFSESHKKVFKNFSNGIIHNLILWIISKEDIHGYGLMKKLNDFFNFEDSKCEISINSSKIYPILSKMEKRGFIVGEWKINENNKRVKFYSITREGELFLENIQNHFNIILKNPSWMAFFEEMTGKRFNNEKRNRN